MFLIVLKVQFLCPKCYAFNKLFTTGCVLCTKCFLLNFSNENV